MSHHKISAAEWLNQPQAQGRERQRVLRELGHAIMRLQERLKEKQNAEAAVNSPRMENAPSS